ncbi:MAG: class I SAM-dependent methyltransferase [Pseudomonadota bacterium]|nr:class I SAM-dependent methyltransferase [Pseudomonadota bacterium]
MTADPTEQDFRAAATAAAARLAEALLAAPGPAAREIAAVLPHPFSNMTRDDWTRAIDLWRRLGAPLLKELPPRPCPACGASEADALFESFDGHPYVECRGCRTWYVPLRVNGELYKRYFERAPEARRYGDYTDVQGADASVAAVDRARFDDYYADLLHCLGGEARRFASLDIGCGVGNSLDSARARGIEAFGVEVNENAVAVARRAGRAVSFPQELPPERTFDLITLWETLEHIDTPLDTLRWAAARLAPGGVLAITVPNLNSPAIRSMRADSMQIHGGPAWPGHINLYTQQTLALLLARAGFQAADVCGQYSMNLHELAAYHLGRWSGARDYARADAPQVVLPAAAAELARAMATVATAWEEAAAFAPILRVFAVRKGEAAPPGLVSMQAARRARIAARLSGVYGVGGGARSGVRGEPAPLSTAAWRDERLELAGGGARFSGRAAPYAYLWKSPPVSLDAGDEIRLRGKLYAGGVSVGLQKDGVWATTAAADRKGVFELAVAAPAAGVYEIVVANHNPADAPTDVDLDRIERVIHAGK